MITATEGLDEHGQECWDIFEIDEDGEGQTAVRIARYETNAEAIAFCDGINWPDLRRKLWQIRFAHAVLQDEEAVNNPATT